MRKLYFLWCVFLVANSHAQTINFPDLGLKQRLLSGSASYQVAKNLAGNWVDIDTNNDNEIQLSEALQISYLNVDGFMVTITSIQGLEYFTNLQELKVQHVDCTAINFSGFGSLQALTLSNNELLTALDLSSLTSLTTLTVDHNPMLAALDVSAFSGLTSLTCHYNALTSIDVSNLNNLVTLACYQESIATLDLNGMSNLETLNCSYLDLTALDLTGLNNIKTLNCFGNAIPVLDVSAMPQLRDLNCGATLVTQLGLQNAPNLQKLYISNTDLTNLDLSANGNLKQLYCSYNSGLIVDLTPLVNLEILEYVSSGLTQLDLSACTKLKRLKCDSNNLTTLDLTHQFQLEDVDTYFNPVLVSILAKNGSSEIFNSLPGCPALRYICVDENQVAGLEANIASWGLTQVAVNSYCSFVPGGEFYTITGHARLDVQADGCSEADPGYPYQRLSITNGAVQGGIIANSAGLYSIPVQSGSHTVTPILENPAYFSISPASLSVDFPASSSPSLQDFCLLANGSHPDLAVVLVPVDRARPGFDAQYKILFQNKGTTFQSGSVHLAFNDALTDHVSSFPAASASTDLLTWDFTDLQPFEMRTIWFTLNVNSPVETPPVNNNDILSFTATITGDPADENPADNVFGLRQTVVNAFDPNDKTCLEGNVVGPEMAGAYVHYLIRFENTGTAQAVNVVLKDVVDAARFDVALLVPIDGSHDFYTRIDGNKVEFIFENINLPFDDANNDGYVVFKIKTRPTLVAGDTFSNAAAVYFDYNHPVVTDPAVTVISVLGEKDFEFSDVLTLYPNPAAHTIHIKSGLVLVSTVSIYSLSGQLLAVADGHSPIDVSGLPSGSYLVKVATDKGTSHTKFIKK